MDKVIGVYQILNKKNGKRYVGGTRNISHRESQHLCSLKVHGHTNPLLQRDYDQYGKSVFQFSILEILDNLDEEKLIELEQKWLDLLHPEYNVNKIAGKYMGEYIRTPEALDKRKLKMKGKHIHTEAHKEELRIRFTGPNNPLYGKRFTDEERKVMSEKLSGSGNPNFGKRPVHKTSPKRGKRSEYSVSFIDPNGIEFRGIKNLKAFCLEHGLNLPCMSMLTHGKRKQYRGWVFAP